MEVYGKKDRSCRRKSLTVVPSQNLEQDLENLGLDQKSGKTRKA